MSRALPAGMLLLTAVLSIPLAAEDWPEWRGAGRQGVWHDTGVLQRFPVRGLEVTWRTPIGRGYAGPAVANGFVFVTDARREAASRIVERLLALDEQTGAIRWTHEWTTNYAGLEATFAMGPRATPTVDGNRVFVLGTRGDLLALDTMSGAVVWQKDFVEDFDASIPSWGNRHIVVRNDREILRASLAAP